MKKLASKVTKRTVTCRRCCYTSNSQWVHIYDKIISTQYWPSHSRWMLIWGRPCASWVGWKWPSLSNCRHIIREANWRARVPVIPLSATIFTLDLTCKTWRELRRMWNRISCTTTFRETENSRLRVVFARTSFITARRKVNCASPLFSRGAMISVIRNRPLISCRILTKRPSWVC